MKAFKQINTLLLVFLFSLLLVNCEKVDPKMELLNDPTSELNASALKATPMDATAEINYLLGLIETIESMLEEGLLNRGNANALIKKIENAIKSIVNGNTNAASGQLGAFTSQVEVFVETGIFTEEQGYTLINVAENVVKTISGDPVITDGLIAFYPFNGNTNDGSGNERDGVSSNITFTTDRNNGLNAAVYFDGDGLIQVPGIGQTNSSFSMAFWYKTNLEGTILATDNIFMGIDDDPYYPRFITSWNISIGNYAPGGNRAYLDNTWHHVVVTHDANDSRIITYFDGVVGHNRPNSGYFLGNNEDIYFGIVIKEYPVIFHTIDPYFIGSLDDVYFFDRAISSSEVDQLFY